MATTWNVLKPRLVTALVDAFDENGFSQMLEFACQQKLGHLTADRLPFPQKVYEVIGVAEKSDWLADLVRGAKTANAKHAGLNAVAADVLAGIAAQGVHFYQQSVIDAAAGIAEEAVLLRQIHPYLETLQRRSAGIPLAGLDESSEKSKEMALAQLFVALNVGARRADFWRDSDGKGELRDALGHLHAGRRLILLGDPGSGKSTLLRYVAYCLAEAVRQPGNTQWRERLAWPVLGKGGKEGRETIAQTHHWTGELPVPVFILLRDFARRPFAGTDGTALVDYVCEQLDPEGLGSCTSPLRELAKRGRLLFLLDGVDEVAAAARPALWQAIQALDKGVYGGNRWVATCRVLSFDKDEAPAGVPVQTLQPLDEGQIDKFIGNWFTGMLESGQLSREQTIVKEGALKSAVRRPDLQELAQNPMLLTIMALVQAFRGTLPDDRAMLYQSCVETLLLRWQLRLDRDADGGMPDALRSLGATRQDLERLLWEIAWEAHSKAEDRSRSADIPRWEVIRIAEEHLGSLGKAEQFLEYTEQRAHLLVGRGGRREQVYSFPHRTFQEYLAACHLAANRRFARRAKELAAESADWREVLNLAVGALTYNQQNREKAFDAVKELLLARLPAADDAVGWRLVWLTGEMCATIGRAAAERDEVGQEVLPELRRQLVALLAQEALTPQQRAEAGDALGNLGDPRPGVCTLEPDLIDIPAGEFAYGKDERRTIQKAYRIARYPVTVAQFKKFMEAGGYEEPRYWGGKQGGGWQWRVSKHPDSRGKEPITQPRYWLQPRWHGENRPIVGVSWYEAQAYCAWLTEQSERTYRLPTEEEWERAARHTDGREWAWGNEWEDGIVNTREAQVGRTTAVGAFPRGAAECGAQDMSGDVWEWTDNMSVRGGSWNYNRDDARVAGRDWDYPDSSNFYYGFRVVSPVF